MATGWGASQISDHGIMEMDALVKEARKSRVPRREMWKALAVYFDYSPSHIERMYEKRISRLRARGSWKKIGGRRGLL